MSERVSGPNGFPPADRPFRHCHRCRTQGIRRGGRIAAEYDPFGYSAPVVEHRDKTRSRMRRERCPARKFARSVIARGRRQRLRTDIRPAVARRSPSVRPHGIRSRQNDFQITAPIRPSDKIYQQESPAENRRPNGTSSGSEPPDRQVRRHRRNKCGSQAEPRSKNRRTAQERSVRRGSLRQPATDNRNPIVADRYPIGPAPPFHASSSKFSLSMADRSPRTSRGQTKKPTRFASARRTAYRNRTSICRLRIYRPNR